MQNIKLKWNSFYLEFLYSKLYYIKHRRTQDFGSGGGKAQGYPKHKSIFAGKICTRHTRGFGGREPPDAGNFFKTVYIKYSKIAIFVGFEGKIFGKFFFLLLKISVGILFFIKFS